MAPSQRPARFLRFQNIAAAGDPGGGGSSAGKPGLTPCDIAKRDLQFAREHLQFLRDKYRSDCKGSGIRSAGDDGGIVQTDDDPTGKPGELPTGRTGKVNCDELQELIGYAEDDVDNAKRQLGFRCPVS